MLRAIIVDDEQESINALRIKLEGCPTPVDIVETVTNARLLLPMLKNVEIDILFLDIEMPGLNGLTLLDAIQDRSFEVILVTAYNKYALKALKANALDYLMKPVDRQELQLAIDKVTHRKNNVWKQAEVMQQLSRLSNMLQHVNPLPSKLALSSLSETYYVCPEDIIYISGENNYSTFYLKDGRNVVVCKTLKDYEDQLSSEHFFRVHKSYLININYVKKLNKGIELSVSMSNDSVIEIAARKKAEFLKLMKETTQ